MKNQEEQAALKTRHRTKTKRNTISTTHKTKRMSNEEHPNNLGIAQMLANRKLFFFL